MGQQSSSSIECVKKRQLMSDKVDNGRFRGSAGRYPSKSQYYVLLSGTHCASVWLGRETCWTAVRELTHTCQLGEEIR